MRKKNINEKRDLLNEYVETLHKIRTDLSDDKSNLHLMYYYFMYIC